MVGNLLVGQSGGCTAVMNASLVGVLEQAARTPSIGRVYGMLHGVLGLLDDDTLELRADDAAFRRELLRVPAAALGSCRHRLAGDDRERALTTLRRLDIRTLHYIGGNDSARTSLDLARAAAHAGYDLRVVGIPKTVDNDLPMMDHSPGFGSAARFLMNAVVDAGCDTLAMRRTDPVKVLEVGGRNAGWLAAASSLVRRTQDEPPHLVYLPECALNLDTVVMDVARVLARTGWAVLVVSEGVRTEDGELVAAARNGVQTDHFGHPQLGGAGRTLTDLISERLGVRAKYDRPGSLQRLLRAYLSPVDLREARAAGRAAVRMAVRGESGVMAALQAERTPTYRSWFTSVPLERIAESERAMPTVMRTPPDAFPAPSFRAYATPLVGPMPSPDPLLLPPLRQAASAT